MNQFTIAFGDGSFQVDNHLTVGQYVLLPLYKGKSNFLLRSISMRHTVYHGMPHATLHAWNEEQPWIKNDLVTYFQMFAMLFVPSDYTPYAQPTLLCKLRQTTHISKFVDSDCPTANSAETETVKQSSLTNIWPFATHIKFHEWTQRNHIKLQSISSKPDKWNTLIGFSKKKEKTRH